VTTVDQHLRDDAARAEASRHTRPAVADRQQPAAAGDETTGWRDADERLRLAVDAGDIGTWDFSPATGEVTWSDRCKTMFGVSEGEESSISLFFARLHDDDRPRVEQKLADALDPAGDGKYEAEFRIIRPDGNIGWLVCRGRALYRTGKCAPRDPAHRHGDGRDGAATRRGLRAAAR